MKKNKMMRVASALLVAVLLTTCAISGTFAKYVTQDSAEDNARVAKWGVELQVFGNLYGGTYNKDSIIVKDDATNVTVQSKFVSPDRDDVVAPGTKNATGFIFSLKGQPEVAGTVKTTMKIQNVFLKAGTYGLMVPVDTSVVTEENFGEFTDLYEKDGETFKAATAWATSVTYYTLEDYVVVADGYYPVVYNLAGSTDYTGDDTADSLKGAADKIAKQLGMTDAEIGALVATNCTYTYEATKTFAANDDLAGWKVDGLTLTWAWAYTDSTGEPTENDKADTILGLLENTTEGTVVKLEGGVYKKLVEYTDYCLDTQFSLDITVTQAD